MAGGLNIEIDDLFGRDARKKRQQEAAVLAQNLLQRGAEPSTVNQIANDYANTGEIKLPQYETKALPFDPEVPEGRSTRQTFQLDRKRKGLFAFDSANGSFTQQETPEGMTDFEVKSYNVGKAPRQGYTIYVNSQTGEELRREKNNNGKDDVVRISPPRPGKDDPDTALAKDTLKKYQAALLRGDDIPDEFMDSVRSAADTVGVDVAEVQKDPGVLDQLWNAGAAAVSKVPGVPKVAPATPKVGGSAVRFKPKQGKPLTKAVVDSYVKEAKGDLPKAKKLAIEAGYAW